MNTVKLRIISALIMALLMTGFKAMAQKDERAREILEAMTAAYNEKDGLEIKFGGTVGGKILLKGNMFMLDCDGMKTWFDGVTQWSFIEESNEVNISSPTQEELGMANPYAMIRMYENGYNYKFMGTEKIKGESCSKILMIPEAEQNYQSITVWINETMVPVHIEFVYTEEDKETISVEKYKTRTDLTEDNFRFDMDAHPDAEIIDLR